MVACVSGSIPTIRKRSSCSTSVVEDAERRVAGAGDLARHLEQALEQRVEVELGDDAAADLDEASESVFVHVGLARRHDT